MHQFLAKFFKSDKELEEHILWEENSFGRRENFIIGLYGMTSEESMIKGQESLGHLYNAVTQCVNNWTENFRKTDEGFKNLWTTEEWQLLIDYEKEFMAIYPRLTNWKHEPPKAPKLFENPNYRKHKELTTKLFEQLSKG